MINFKVTDIKQYIYCPRIIYYTYVLPVERKITFKMEFGKEQHIELDRLERRRKLRSYGFVEGERLFHLKVSSERLGLHGIVDMVIVEKVGNITNYYPVEFKNTTHKPGLNHKYQLTAYAMLLEEYFNKPVREGFIYVIPGKEIYDVSITQNMRDYLKKIISAMHNIVLKERVPEIRSIKHCRDCEYRNYCADVR